VALGDGELSGEKLLRNADLAMYGAKRRGKGCHVLYEDDMQAQARERVSLRTRLEGALERGEFELAYQPVVDLDGLSVVGAEALVRWALPGGKGAAPAA
jgi:predicted signal transduction protein with EAL and GGDEF domain